MVVIDTEFLILQSEALINIKAQSYSTYQRHSQQQQELHQLHGGQLSPQMKSQRGRVNQSS